MSSFVLKLIALVTMVIDRVGAVFGESVAVPLMSAQVIEVMRTIGRASFPIYAFMLVQGFRHTRNWKKYALRLLGLGALSQIPYAFAVNNWVAFYEIEWWQRFTNFNVLFTLALGVLMLAFLNTKRFEKQLASWWSIAALTAISAVFYITKPYNGGPVVIALGIAAGLTLAARFIPKLRAISGQATRFALFGFLLFWILQHGIPILGKGWINLQFDYGIYALALFAALYWAKTPLRSAAVIAAWGLWINFGALWQILLVAAAAVCVAFYNGKKGLNDHRLFYWAYPAHLFIIWAVFEILT